LEKPSQGHEADASKQAPKVGETVKTVPYPDLFLLLQSGHTLLVADSTSDF
jgi:hypothetical protein